jgi:hypothetical protein
MRSLILAMGLAVAACGGAGGTTASVQPVATVDESQPSVDVGVNEPAATTPVKKPTTYVKLSDRNWKRLVKSPDRYAGKGYILWACVTQFDAATGTTAFRADAANKKVRYWSLDGTNAWFTGPEKRLEDVVQGDLVSMKAIGTGAYSYDTQAGGNTTVPSFEVASVSRKGTCE